jgi:flagellum-specific peptidoglycan hydrolase FlgJ
MSKEEFFKKYYNFALAATKGTGLSPILILSQAYVESGGGKSSLAAKYNNFFGVKAGSTWQGKTVTLRTREQTKDGKDYFINASFRVYANPYESFMQQITFLKKNPRYTKAGLFSYPDNFAKQADTLQKAGYATDTRYAKILTDVSNNFLSVLNKLKPVAKPIAAVLPLALLFLLAKKFI